jgi:hypothetical protein
MYPNPKKSKLLEALQALRQDFEAAVLREIEAHPEWPFWRVGEQVGISEATVQKISKSNNISRPAGPRPKSDITEEGGL